MACLSVLCLGLSSCGAGRPEREPLFGEKPADGLDLRTALGAEQVALLDEVVLTLDLYVADGIRAPFTPAVPKGFRGEVDEQTPEPWADGTWHRYLLRLRPTEVGALKVPPFLVQAEDSDLRATTPELELEVLSLLADAAAEIEAPAPPFPVPFDPLPWLVGAGAVAVLGLCMLLWLRRARSIAYRVATELPPHVKALRALARLRTAPRSTPPEVDAFYVAVSLVLRVYLEERFGLHAPERTTEEFLPEVERTGLLGREQELHLRQFLQQCDLVKFARMLPGEDVHDATFGFVESFVESTRQDRRQEGAA